MMVSVTPLSKFVQYMICLFPSTLPSPKLQQKPIQLLQIDGEPAEPTLV